MKYSISFLSLPFQLEYEQVLYVENEYDKEINCYIQNHYDEICEIFKQKDLEFIYIPRIVDEVADTQAIHYNAPYAKQINDRNVVTSRMMLDYMKNPENRIKISPSILYNSDISENKLSEEDTIIYKGRFLEPDYVREKKLSLPFSVNFEQLALDINREVFKDQYDYHFSDGDDFQFSETEAKPRTLEDTDNAFDDESKQMMWSVKEIIEKLRLKGIKQYVLDSLVKEEKKLSPLVITNEFRIFLPDYNHMEIVMQPLLKSVYLLFLNHPEGILFKCLPDYREELTNIYRMISRKQGSGRMDKSIEAVTDPLNNSINEKCARIRESFITKFDENLASHYYITGKRGCPKKITLSPELVIREDC